MTNLNDAVSAHQSAASELSEATRLLHGAEDNLARAKDRYEGARQRASETRKALVVAVEALPEDPA